ncbi:MAG TPA: PLD nuclease N-terminal domain-containing protein [Sedimentisphaerales bacterium]
MNSDINWAQLLPLLIPVAIIELGLLVWALLDIIRRKNTKGPKIVWIIVVVLFEIIGPIAYFIFGRGEESAEDDSETKS